MPIRLVAARRIGAFRGRLAFLAYRSLAGALRALPRPAVAVVAAVSERAIVTLWRSRRPLVSRNLRRVLGPDVGEAELQRVVTASFVSYARYWIGAARVAAWRSDEIEDLVTSEGFDKLREEMARGHGVIVALPHIGAWEYGGRWLAQQGYPMTTVGELLEPPELFEWFTAQRAKLGLEVLPPGPETSVRLLDTLRDGRVVGLLADRDLGQNGVETEFFGERTTLPGGPALLALRAGAPILTCAIFQRPNDRIHVVLNAPLQPSRSGRLRDDVRRLTETMARELEDLIRQAPEQWHLFQPNWPSDRAL